MPWHIVNGHSECPTDRPVAVVKDSDSSVSGCHPNEAAARRQMAALYAQESMSVTIGGKPMIHKTVKAEAERVTDQGVFSAVAAAWSTDRMGERIIKGAFADTIKNWQNSGKKIPLHWDHKGEADQIIGYIDPDSLEETDDGLYVEGQIDLEDSEVAREAWRSMKNNAVGLSFGYIVLQDREPEMKGDPLELLDIDLFEISITPAPVNADTRIVSMKSASPATVTLGGGSFVLYQHTDGFWAAAPPDLDWVTGVVVAGERSTDKSWDHSLDRFTDAEYARSCVLDRAKDGSDGATLSVRSRYSLPIREPNGTLNVNALMAATERIADLDGTSSVKSARAALRHAWAELGEDVPDVLKVSEAPPVEKPEPEAPPEEVPEEGPETPEIEDPSHEDPATAGQVRAQDPLRKHHRELELEIALGRPVTDGPELEPEPEPEPEPERPSDRDLRRKFDTLALERALDKKV